LSRKKTVKQILFRFAVYGLVAFLIVAPWYLKNWVQTGNPVWPFLLNVFGGKNWDELGTANLIGFIQLPNMDMTIRNWLTGFYQLTVNSNSFGGPRVSLGWNYLILLPFALPWMFSKRTPQRTIFRWMFIILVALYTNWFITTHQSRFLMPILPIFALLAGCGLANWLNLLPPKFAAAITILLLSLLASSHWIFNPDARAILLYNWRYYRGSLTRDQYISGQSIGYETYLYANNQLPTNAKVWLALYETRGYYLNRTYAWANPISQREIKIEQYPKSEDLAAELKRRGFDYIIFNPNKIQTYLYIPHGPEITQTVRDLLANQARLLYTSADKGLELYELTP
jgi:hypothetical protein